MTEYEPQNAMEPVIEKNHEPTAREILEQTDCLLEELMTLTNDIYCNIAGAKQDLKKDAAPDACMIDTLVRHRNMSAYILKNLHSISEALW